MVKRIFLVLSLLGLLLYGMYREGNSLTSTEVSEAPRINDTKNSQNSWSSKAKKLKQKTSQKRPPPSPSSNLAPNKAFSPISSLGPNANNEMKRVSVQEEFKEIARIVSLDKTTSRELRQYLSDLYDSRVTGTSEPEENLESILGAVDAALVEEARKEKRLRARNRNQFRALETLSSQLALNAVQKESVLAIFQKIELERAEMIAPDSEIAMKKPGEFASKIKELNEASRKNLREALSEVLNEEQMSIFISQNPDLGSDSFSLAY